MRRAVILDDGVSPDCALSHHFAVTEKGELAPYEPEDGAAFSHGTACMKIIQKYTKEKAFSWHSVKILPTNKGKGSIEGLLTGLAYCKKVGAKVVHLSVGSQSPFDFERVAALVKELTQSGCVLIAALSNEKKITYPACLPDVIGVCAKEGLTDDTYQATGENPFGVDFFASGAHLLRFGKRARPTKVSNSFAAPVITAKVINLLSGHPDASPYEIVERLGEKAPVSSVRAGTGREFFGAGWRAEDETYEMKAPVIAAVSDHAGKMEELVRGLSDFFWGEGYVPCVLTDDKADLSWGARIMEKEGNTITALYDMDRFIHADVLIFKMEGNTFFKVKGLADIVLTDRPLSLREGYRNAARPNGEQVIIQTEGHSVFSIIKKVEHLLT